MSRILLSLIISSSLLLGQNYRWPIRASQSLSATFSEYRSGHLHAGIDIKTWGEMEVPCLAVAEGYIEYVAVGYNGYGRGVWLRLNDGNIAVYGHLERYNPVLEKLIKAEQISQDKYSIHLKFTPDQYPVHPGDLVGYSGTSGTEHPHLHFELRDTSGQVYNPQFFYPGIRDQRAPLLDEIMLIPVGLESRINASQFPVIFDMDQDVKPIAITGPFRVALNTHDRAMGTYNKYNIYHAAIMVNDSLVFEREFDQIAMRLTDEVDEIYPGSKGKRGWRFMSMYHSDTSATALFSPDSLSGIISPAQLSELKIKVSDLEGNDVVKSLLFHKQVLGTWDVSVKGNRSIITRHFTGDGYESFKFYTGNNTFIPIIETLYRLNSTSWVFDNGRDITSGVRALGADRGLIKWIVPPIDQATPEIDYNWKRKGAGYVLQIGASDGFIFPLAYSLNIQGEHHQGELVQTGPTHVETDVVPLHRAALAESIEFIYDTQVLGSLRLAPLDLLAPGQTRQYSIDTLGVRLSASNPGSADQYIKVDTAVAEFNQTPVLGIDISLVGTSESQFSGQLLFSQTGRDTSLSIFSPGKKDSWERLIAPDSLPQNALDIVEGGTFFFLSDSRPPNIEALDIYTAVRHGDRLVFKITDNSGNLSYPRTGIRANLDGSLFFPDFNPLRHELSFHIPKRLGSGQHIFQFSIRDESGNQTEFQQKFSVKY